MDDIAISLVNRYITEHFDTTDKRTPYVVFIMWQAKVLQNWKYLISTTLQDGMYYELTYNGDELEWYIDAYKKLEHHCITL